MADFYFDHNIAVEIAHVIRSSEHTATTAGEIGLASATDDEHLVIAAKRGAVLIMHNRKDFILLHDAWRRWSAEWNVTRRHAGILVVAQLNPTWISRTATEVVTLVETDLSLANMLYIWRPAAGWRQLP